MAPRDGAPGDHDTVGLVEDGSIVGSYGLVERIGAGGMGEVWLAKHEVLGRPAIVKLVQRPSLGSESQDEVRVRRFRREARAIAALRSPHTVELYEFGVNRSGSCYYVMEYLQGMDLEEMVRRYGPVPPARAAELLKQACLSLAEAHENGLIHRDIKPANLYACQLGSSYDVLKVLDFGVVKSRRGNESAPLTGTNLAVGTPAYMAPETATGADLDERVDLYSLGCVAFWLLTGRLVFESNNPTEMMLKHVQETPPAPSEFCEEPVPGAFDELVLRCLAKDPRARPLSAEILWDELDALPLASRWTHGRARRWWRRHVPAS